MFKKNNKGFTLIELVVIMAVLAIIVLYAAPNVMSYGGKAKLTQIKNDVKIAEDLMTEYLIKNRSFPGVWNNISAGQLRVFANNGKVYSKKGKTINIEETNYKEIDNSYLKKIMSTKLNGKFYINNDGTAYYADIDNSDLNDLTEENFDFIRETKNPDKNNNLKLKVLSYQFPNGIYKYGDSATGNIKVQGVQSGDYKLDFALVHSKSKITINTTTDFNIDVGEVKEINFNHLFVGGNRLGFYDLYLIISENTTIITSYNVCESIYLGSEYWEYFYEDDFYKISMPSIGGIGKLVPENVDFSYTEYDSILGADYSSSVLKTTPNTNETGQIATKLPVTYSTYEAKIKVPDSDALLNGFFLYGANKEDTDITYEIDIEILYKDSRWQVWTTIFNPTHECYKSDNGLEPGAIYHTKMDLSFDPSEDYHNYKINFYRNYISFMIDDIEISKWNGTFNYSDMHLYASTFYTHWLSKDISTTEKQMDVAWVRRAYMAD